MEIKFGNRTIGLNHPTYFIADIAANHDGASEKSDWNSSRLIQGKLSDPHWQNLIAFSFILFFALINVISMRHISETNDEDKHYLYGVNIVSGYSDRIDDSSMPSSAINALPIKIASFLQEGKLKSILGKFIVARMMTVLFSCFVAFLVFYWSRSLYGFIPALISLILYILDPNIIAHSQLITTDLYATGTITFAFFALWKFAHQRSLKNGLLLLFALGISQLAKYTTIVLLPLLFLTLFIYDFPALIASTQLAGKIRILVTRYFLYIISAVIASLLIINLGFLFNRTFTFFGEYQTRSELFQNLQDRFNVLHYIPILVPYPYLDGLDWMINTAQTGNRHGNIYLLGHLSTLKGFPGYYFVASFLKVPIATQIILILAFVAYFTRKNRRDNFLKNEIFLLISVVFFTIYFNFFFDAQLGIRYYLPVFPLLYIFSGNLFIGWKSFSFVKRLSIWALIGYLFISVFSYHPYYLSYFNEIIWDRKQAYKYLADSNIDWGQGKNELRQYLLEHPGALYAPGNVRPGRFVVRVNDLVGVTADPERYAWLRNNFEPVDIIAYSYLVYKVSPEEIDNLCATTVYCKK